MKITALDRLPTEVSWVVDAVLGVSAFFRSRAVDLWRLASSAPTARRERIAGVSTRGILREFFLNGLHWDERTEPLTDDLPLIDSGAVDSMGILMLATFLEERFAIEVRDEDIVPENFGTLAALATYVQRKRGSHRDRPSQHRPGRLRHGAPRPLRLLRLPAGDDAGG